MSRKFSETIYRQEQDRPPFPPNRKTRKGEKRAQKRPKFCVKQERINETTYGRNGAREYTMGGREKGEKIETNNGIRDRERGE